MDYINRFDQYRTKFEYFHAELLINVALLVLNVLCVWTSCSVWLSSCLSPTGGATLSSRMWSSSGRARPTGFTTASFLQGAQRVKVNSPSSSTQRKETGFTSDCRHDDHLLSKSRHGQVNIPSSQCFWLTFSVCDSAGIMSQQAKRCLTVILLCERWHVSPHHQTVNMSQEAQPQLSSTGAPFIGSPSVVGRPTRLCTFLFFYPGNQSDEWRSAICVNVNCLTMTFFCRLLDVVVTCANRAYNKKTLVTVCLIYVWPTDVSRVLIRFTRQ